MSAPRILLFDSGMGGLTVAARCAPPARGHISSMPPTMPPFPMAHGTSRRWSSASSRSLGLLIERTEPDLVVIACNTASTLALAALRERYDVPFVGTVPAIKPAAQQTKSGIIGVLATPGTVKREYTRALIDTYAYHCKVFLHGAQAARRDRRGEAQGQAPWTMGNCARRSPRSSASATASAPTSWSSAARTIRCCIEEITRIAPWPVVYIDPAPAIARRTAEVLKTVTPANGDAPYERGTVFLTAARSRNTESLAAYAVMGFPHAELADIPV